MYYVRYIDWLITTPMMLLALCHFGNARTVLTNYLISMDLLMILSGLIGATIDGGEKWVFFGVAMLFFLPVIYYLLVLYSQILDNRVYDFFGEWLVADGSMPTKGKTGLTRGVLLPYLFYFPNYRTLAALTIVLWFLYPVMWILTEGTSVLSSDFEAIGYTVIDVLAKVVFGFVIVQSRRYRLRDMPAGVTFMLDDDEVAMVLSSPASGSSFL
jgi:bacteriorhodopsin